MPEPRAAGSGREDSAGTANVIGGKFGPPGRAELHCHSQPLSRRTHCETVIRRAAEESNAGIMMSGCPTVIIGLTIIRLGTESAGPRRGSPAAGAVPEAPGRAGHCHGCTAARDGP